MKGKVFIPAFQRALGKVIHATSSSSVTPVLENILIDVNERGMDITANNLEIAIQYTLFPWDVEIESFWFCCIPSRILYQYVYLLQEEWGDFELTKDNALLLSTFSSQIKIKGIDAKDFPLLPEMPETRLFSVHSYVLKKWIEKTLFSVAEQSIRPTFAGIFFGAEKEKLFFTSTDSFRLTEYVCFLFWKESEISFSCILPKKTAGILKSLFEGEESVECRSNDNQIVFIMKHMKIYSRLINGTFPEYEDFFPKSYHTKMIAKKTELIQSLKKVHLISKTGNYMMKISFFPGKQKVHLETLSTEIWESRVVLEARVEGKEEITLWINSEYLLQVLQVIESNEVVIYFEWVLSPVFIGNYESETWEQKDLFRHILMPLKI